MRVKNLDTWRSVLESNQKRNASDAKRYHKYHGIDASNEENFDFVLDTSNLDIAEVFEKVSEFVLSQAKKIEKSLICDLSEGWLDIYKIKL